MIKKHKKAILFVIFLIMASLLNASPIIVPERATVFTEQNAMELFKSEWSLVDLLQNTVYLAGEEINIDYWFSEKADINQIHMSRSIVIYGFVLRHIRRYGPFPYGDLIANRSVTWETVSCRVYRGNELLFHDRYDKDKQLIR